MIIYLNKTIFQQADIYLLDDPLSAVDTHVGKHLIAECVMGLLRHSTRILVTHQLHHLKSADKIIILRNVSKMNLVIINVILQSYRGQGHKAECNAAVCKM